MSDHDDLMTGLIEIESALHSLRSHRQEVLANIENFRSLSEQAQTSHEFFEDSMKEFESLVREVELIHEMTKNFVERYGKKLPPKKSLIIN